jgi:hypothetical protein
MSYDGYRVKTSSNPSVFVVIDNLKRHVPDMATYNNLFENTTDIQVVTQPVLNSIAAGPPLTTGAILAKGSGPSVYLISNGQRRHIKTMEAMDKFDFAAPKIVSVPDSILNAIPIGAEIT